MSSREWWQEREHPYATVKATRDTHAHLLPTRIRMPAYSTLATPFWWMLQQNQEHVDARSPEPLPPDDEAPFHSAWVFGRARQEAIGDLFFGRLTAGSSLVVFYTKSGHPLGESINRLVVGIGRLDKIGPMLRYDVEKGRSYPLWERSVEHSIRPSGAEGFLVPYHDYLEPTGDPDEDRRRAELVHEVAVVPEQANIAAYSYAGELASSDITLSTCVKALDIVRGSAPTESHGAVGTARGLAQRADRGVWRDRGAFPGLGSALEALGMRLGTALTYDLVATGRLGQDDDPWQLVDAVLRGTAPAPRPEYEPDLAATRRTWAALSDERRSLLQLLSRFALTPAQAHRWFDPKERSRAIRGAVDDAGILANPYRIAETDLGDEQDHPVSVGTLDRGVLPDDRRRQTPGPGSVARRLAPRLAAHPCRPGVGAAPCGRRRRRAAVAGRGGGAGGRPRSRPGRGGAAGLDQRARHGAGRGDRPARRVVRRRE